MTAKTDISEERTFRMKAGLCMRCGLEKRDEQNPEMLGDNCIEDDRLKTQNRFLNQQDLLCRIAS